MSDGSTVEIRDAIQTTLRRDRLELHTTAVGIVRKYDHSTQLADVEPIVTVVIQDADGEDYIEEHPVIPNVPVRWPGGGGFFLSCPLAVGDHVDLHFHETDHSGWRSSGNKADPIDLRLHSLSFAYATPRALPDTAPLADADAAFMVMGKDGTEFQVRVGASSIELLKGATDYVALASKVDAMLLPLKTALDTFLATGAPNVADGRAVASAISSAIGALVSTASTKVKAG